MEEKEYFFRLWIDTEFVSMINGFRRRIDDWDYGEYDPKLYTFEMLKEEYKKEFES